MMRPMARVPPFDREATYADLEKLPDMIVAEMVGGELHATPRPAPRHAVTGSSLGMELGPPYHQGRGGPGGWWILDEPELHFGRDVLVPDCAGWRRTRMPDMPATAYFTIRLDWVCEVLSPSTAAFDRERKLDVYARTGIPHAWLIDPIARTIEVLRLENGAWRVTATHRDSDIVRVAPFADIELVLDRLWPIP
jgi:Uma2 family endonuclease